MPAGFEITRHTLKNENPQPHLYIISIQLPINLKTTVKLIFSQVMKNWCLCRNTSSKGFPQNETPLAHNALRPKVSSSFQYQMDTRRSLGRLPIPLCQPHTYEMLIKRCKARRAKRDSNKLNKIISNDF